MSEVRLQALDVRVSLREGDQPFSLAVTVDAGPDITVLFGPSGSGKSLTLACISGLRRIDEGVVRLGTETWEDASAGVRVPVEKRRCAYVQQSIALFPHLTVGENVAFGIPRDVRGRARSARAAALLARFRVEALGSRMPGTLSGGEAQRVALARAFAMEPRALLLDEPFSALDRPLRRELWTELRDALAETPVPTILVTHDEDDVKALAAKVVELEHGRVKR